MMKTSAVILATCGVAFATTAQDCGNNKFDNTKTDDVSPTTTACCTDDPIDCQYVAGSICDRSTGMTFKASSFNQTSPTAAKCCELTSCAGFASCTSDQQVKRASFNTAYFAPGLNGVNASACCVPKTCDGGALSGDTTKFFADCPSDKEPKYSAASEEASAANCCQDKTCATYVCPSGKMSNPSKRTDTDPDTAKCCQDVPAPSPTPAFEATCGATTTAGLPFQCGTGKTWLKSTSQFTDTTKALKPPSEEKCCEAATCGRATDTTCATAASSGQMCMAGTVSAGRDTTKIPMASDYSRYCCKLQTGSATQGAVSFLVMGSLFAFV